MANDVRLSRRRFLAGTLSAASALALSGCNQLGQQSSWFRNVLDLGRGFDRGDPALFPIALVDGQGVHRGGYVAEFRANGSTNPDDPEYVAHAENGFADWKLKVGGLVENPMEFSLADLRAMPSRTQITRHDCVEGWSCIGKWTGVQLALVLDKVRLKPETRYILFTCADQLEKTLDGSGRYYETLALEDAYHPQTILAYDMNGGTLPVPYGAPLRVRVERQLGYKMAKYIMSIDAIDSFESLGSGQGSYWADRGYDWYAGI